MPRRTALALAALLACSAAAEPPGYHVRAGADDGAALGAALEAEGLDVLEGGVTADGVELIVTPAELALLRARGHEIAILAESRPFVEIQAERRAAHRGDAPPGYPTLDEVYQRMQAAAARRPDLCRFVDLTAELGTVPSEEGRHLFAVKVSADVAIEEDEPSTLLVSLHHAREVVTPIITLHAMDQLVDGYGVDPVITGILDAQEVWIAPIWNPDGYEFVFHVSSTWRKNRRDNGDGTFGVDLNRNYPFGWDGQCTGSTDTGDATYKGSAPASEAETQTMMAWTERERFARVLDFHSSGRETLYGYLCLGHPLEDFLREEAEGLSAAAGYTHVRPPSAEGEHQEWQLSRGAFAFLMETHTTFQPTFESAQQEAEAVYGAIVAMLLRPLSVTGLVTDADSGEPLDAEVLLPEAPFRHGERVVGGSPAGRYHLVLPDWITELIAFAPGHDRKTVALALTPGATVAQDIQLTGELAWSFPAGVPAKLAPLGGETIHVEVAGAGSREPQPGTGMLHVDTGDGFTAHPMTETAPNVYEALTPRLGCLPDARFFFSALDTAGRPSFAPGGVDVLMATTGEAEPVTPPLFGDLHLWTVQNIAVDNGPWEYGQPGGLSSRGEPRVDADGNALAWLTGPAPRVDLDGGPTILLSPSYDLSSYGHAVLRYARWMKSMDGAIDELTVEASSDGGVEWVHLETTGPTVPWDHVEFDLGDFIELTDAVRVRFLVSDNPNDSQTEAGIDAFEIVGLLCAGCRADLTGDGSLDFFDFLAFQNLFAAGDPRADFTGDGVLDFFDFLAFQNEFAAGCP